MSVLSLMIPMAIILGILFLGAFIWAVSKGQFDDTETPAYRILNEDKIELKQGFQRKERTTGGSKS